VSDNWPAFGQDPKRIRASDAERDKIITALHEHYAQGRLDFDELSARLDQVGSSQTRGELERVLHDLPVPSGLLDDPLPPVRPMPSMPKQSFRERTGLSTWQIVGLVVAAMIILPIVGRIVQGLMPILIIGVVIWLVQRSRTRRC
jgi:hypothetical protein